MFLCLTKNNMESKTGYSLLLSVINVVPHVELLWSLHRNMHLNNMKLT